MILLNPKKHVREYPDEFSKQVMLKTIEFFESKGKGRLKEDDRKLVWYADFLEFIKQERIFARFLTPPEYGDVHESKTGGCKPVVTHLDLSQTPLRRLMVGRNCYEYREAFQAGPGSFRK